MSSSEVTAAALIFALVAGIIVWQLTNETVLVVLYVALIAFGIYFLISVPFANNEAGFIPSQRSFRLVWGAILTTIGALLLVTVYSKVDLWMIAVILLVVVAVLILIMLREKYRVM